MTFSFGTEASPLRKGGIGMDRNDCAKGGAPIRHYLRTRDSEMWTPAPNGSKDAERNASRRFTRDREGR